MHKNRKLIEIYKCSVWISMLTLCIASDLINKYFKLPFEILVLFSAMFALSLLFELDRVVTMKKYNRKEKFIYDGEYVGKFQMIDILEKDVKSNLLSNRNVMWLTSRLNDLKSEVEKDRYLEEAYEEYKQREIKEIEKGHKKTDEMRRMEIEKLFRFSSNANSIIRFRGLDEYLVYVGYTEYLVKFEKNDIILVDKIRGRNGMKWDF
ncbi:hypothetical protein HBP99_13795 [Listeria booriae]|uniref:hypothetical protein n=1 Tax=Listeria booriae TaxID=1552123 RepID=UPI00162960F1|nr:hypothetical protein [Listeria booriae]MBC2369715.1 hypothetical protein [Listeria booriae]